MNLNTRFPLNPGAIIITIHVIINYNEFTPYGDSQILQYLSVSWLLPREYEMMLASLAPYFGEPLGELKYKRDEPI